MMAVTHSRSDRFVRQPILDLHFIGLFDRSIALSDRAVISFSWEFCS